MPDVTARRISAVDRGPGSDGAKRQRHVVGAERGARRVNPVDSGVDDDPSRAQRRGAGVRADHHRTGGSRARRRCRLECPSDLRRRAPGRVVPRDAERCAGVRIVARVATREVDRARVAGLRDEHGVGAGAVTAGAKRDGCASRTVVQGLRQRRKCLEAHACALGSAVGLGVVDERDVASRQQRRRELSCGALRCRSASDA